MTETDRLARIAVIEQRIAEIRARLPKHSPPASMLVDVDELEDELARLLVALNSDATGQGGDTA